jgi:hypothetical protein
MLISCGLEGQVVLDISFTDAGKLDLAGVSISGSFLSKVFLELRRIAKAITANFQWKRVNAEAGFPQLMKPGLMASRKKTAVGRSLLSCVQLVFPRI